MLGLTLRNMGRLEEAETKLREALDISRAVLGPEHGMTSFCMRYLAQLLYLAGRQIPEAEAMEWQALDILERYLQANHLSDADASVLANSYDGRQEVAGLWEILIANRSMQAQGLHPTARSLGLAAALLQKQGKLPEAEAKAREALHLCSQVFGPAHEQHVQLSISPAAILQKQDRKQEAESLLQQAIRAGESPDPKLEHAVLAKMELAYLLSDLGREDEAVALMRKVLASRSDKYGPDHPLTAKCQRIISNAQPIMSQTKA